MHLFTKPQIPTDFDDTPKHKTIIREQRLINKITIKQTDIFFNVLLTVHLSNM